MKSIGETLREARETKGASIEQISLELNISREYLIALEEEQFDVFPAETYLLGFLRNYSEYLGLDVEKNIGLYKNYKIGEEPTPLEELVGPQSSPAFPLRFLSVVLILGILGAAGWFGYRYIAPRLEAPETSADVQEPVDFALDHPTAEWRMGTGDRILVPYRDGELIMTVFVEENRCRIVISDLPDEDILLFPGDEKILPGGEGIPVLRIKLISLEETEALLQLERTDVEMPREDAADEPLPSPVSVAEEAERVLLAGAEEPGSFTLNAQFNSYSLFRYRADEDTPLERYYREGDRIRLDVDRQLMIWGSSAGAVSLSISGAVLPPGKSGEVLVKFIQWVENDDGKYDLVLFPVR